MLYNHIESPMSRKLLVLSASGALLSTTVLADTPRVAVDIAPVHSLVSRVMQGVAEPDLIIPPGASPHEYNLRPSEAEALQNANIVFWIGEDLTPWMEDAVETLAADADVTSLMEADGTVLLDFREDALFEAHDHGDDEHDDHDDHDDHDEHGEHAEDHDDDHDKHEDHAHEDQHDHDDHAGHKEHGHDEHDEHAHEGHEHGDYDPHVWLSPENAAVWVNVIAAKLSAADPGNAGVYFGNAAAAREELQELVSEVNGVLDPVRGGRFVAFHDAYQYFEVAFDFPASGAISLGDATDPSPARIAEIQGRVAEENIDCVLSEPQFNQGIVNVVMDGAEANTAVLDPLGSALEPGVDLYPQLLLALSNSLAECLSSSS